MSPDKLFTQTLKEALKHIHDPEWLGTHSPFAQPYFLSGYAMGETMPTSRKRGQQLNWLLQDALEDLWDRDIPATRDELLDIVEQDRHEHGNKSHCYYYLLLDLHYFRQYFPSHVYPSRVSEIADYLNVSQARFYVHSEEAIAQLAFYMQNRVQAKLQLERPILQTKLFGRQQLLQTCLTDLQNGHSVTLTGVGGIGKTSLATAICEAWSETAVFWYTIHPQLTDQLPKLLFSLGHFFNQQGIQSHLWLQVIATQGQEQPDIDYLGFVRQDLEQCPHPVLLCFDELDLLCTAYSDLKPNHIALLEFVEALHKTVPLLLLSQISVVDTYKQYELTNLNRYQIQQICHHKELVLTEEDAVLLEKRTMGIPRLVEMYINVIQLEAQSLHLKRVPPKLNLQALFYRLWKRLSASEQKLIMSLSVFRQHAPYDIWQAQQAVLENLQSRHLIQTNNQGNLLLPTHYRQLALNQLLPKQREEIHLFAAQVWATRGNYTESAYHYWQAGDDVAAVKVWLPHEPIEMQRGHAGSALAIFDNISAKHLPKRLRGQFMVMRNRLYSLEGNYAKVTKDNSFLVRELLPNYQAIIQSQKARAMDMLGEPEAALSHYDEAIQHLTELSHQIVLNRKRRQQLVVRQGDWASAKRELALVSFEVVKMKGLLEQYMGNFTQSTTHLEEAVKLGEALGYIEGVAITQHALLQNMSMLGNLSSAIYYAEQVMGHYKNVGDRVRLEGARADLAIVYHQCGQYETAVELYTTALHFFKQVQHIPNIAYITVNLAEAYYELKEYHLATQYATQVQQMEEVPNKYPYALYVLGSVNLKQNNLADAKYCFTQGIQFAQEMHDKYIEARCHLGLGHVYTLKKAPAQAEPLLKKALAQFTEIGFSDQATDIQLIIQLLK